MRRILLVAKNAFRAVMSQRAVYMWGFAILIMFLISGRAIFTQERAPEMLAFIRANSVSAALATWSYLCIAAAIYLGATSIAVDLRSKTIITVLATRIDFGSNINLAVAMAIAVVKATLVLLFFMHLIYDKLFHSVLVGGGLLAATLFVTFALMDSGQYQKNVIGNPEAPPAAPYGPRPLP